MSDCKNCGGVTKCIESEGGIESGEFKEKYECSSCDAWGRVIGHAEESPDAWERKGPIFNGY